MNRFPLVHVVAVRPLDHYRVWLRFSDSTERDLDLWPLICHPGLIFGPLHDVAIFRQVRVVDRSIAWPNGADLDPLILRYYPDLVPAG
jgi:hypothetical protein